MLEKQPANCVHTSITRESVTISSTQLLIAEKCPGMNSGSVFFWGGGGGGGLTETDHSKACQVFICFRKDQSTGRLPCR